MGPPIDTQVDLEQVPVTRGDQQASELASCAVQLDGVAVLSQRRDGGFHRTPELGGGHGGSEQVDVMGGPMDQSVLADGTRARQREPDRGYRRQNDPRGLSLVLLGGRHPCGCYRRSSGNRDSHRSRQRAGNARSGHTARSRSALSSASWRSLVPSRIRFR